MPLSPVRLPTLGVVLAGRYRILEKIGSGGTGDVYRAADEQTRGTVAIKLWRSGSTRDLGQASRLFEGAWTASLMRHQNVVQVHETGLSEFGPFVVMEYLRGEHIGRLLERHGRLKKESCFAIMEPVLLALGTAHSIGLLHGDVKPENVMVCQLPDSRVTVKLLDFGAAAALAEQLVVSTQYLAPERVAGRSFDARSDQFAACVLLFELLTNSLPFHGHNPTAAAHRIAHHPCPTLAQAGLPHNEALSNVVRRGLDKDPSKRFLTVRDLLEALRPLMQGETPAVTHLTELLPLAALLRQESGIMPAFPTAPASQFPRNPSQPSGTSESGVRPSGVVGKQAQVAPSSSPAPRVAERESLAPVLPARHRGRFRARAIIWQALDEYVRSRRPASLRERILYDVGTEEASDLLLGTLQGIVYCELDSITQYIDLVTARLFSRDVTWCRAAGREAVDGVLATALSRSIPPTPDVAVTLRRVCRILGPLFDFGEWQVGESGDMNLATVAISGIDAVCQGLRFWTLGVLERSLTVVHQGASLVVTRGDGAFTPRMVVEVTAG